MKKNLFMWAFAALFLCGCNTCFEPSVMTAAPAEKIVIDGIPNEKCWQNTAEYKLDTRIEAWEKRHPAIAEKYKKRSVVHGKVKLLHDRDFLYISAIMKDDDIIALGKIDQQVHCTEGDVFEIFLKPENADHYWELHITPAGHCAVFFYLARGYHFLRPIVLPPKRPLNVKYKVAVQGTLNKNTDVDKSWSVEVAIPLAELAAKGIPLDFENSWRILTARYNFSRYLPICELSTYPTLSKIDFHIHEEYGKLQLKK